MPEPVSQTQPSASWREEACSVEDDLRILTWDDVCPFGSTITKIAEASYAEVYRISNSKGTSIIKTIRLTSPIKPQNKAQQKARLVDEQPHHASDLSGEIRISELVADIPGFVVYKERYLVRGKGSKPLLETHQTFHRRAKRADPGRAQFYPSPSRYVDETTFLVVELGDAGTALEDFLLEEIEQVWDVFLHTAVALARAEELFDFEHRDLHEGNLCVRQRLPKRKRREGDGFSQQFGYSGLDITILDYGLSRADDLKCDQKKPRSVAYDLEKDLSIFTSTHASQCKVYRQMRSFLLEGDRCHLPPEMHTMPYDLGPDDKPISWSDYHPYTNVLWLAYIYEFLVSHFRGDKNVLKDFRRTTREMWNHLDPEAPPDVLSFSSAGDVVRFAFEAGWIEEEQLLCGDRSRLLAFEEDGDDREGEDFEMASSVAYNESIIEAKDEADESHLRRSPRRRLQRVL
jgi:serine/threonine-protein kinase haspin